MGKLFIDESRQTTLKENTYDKIKQFLGFSLQQNRY